MNKDAQGRRKVERSESNWKCGFESIPLHRVQTEAAGEALKLARARYREQLGTMVELNEAAAQLADAEAAVTTALYDAKIAEAELTFAVGRR